jgi:hypothetical protein
MRSRPKIRELDVRDVLAGRVRLTPTAVELAALIRAVNPTDQKMRPADRERRYIEKAKLQSLLLREHWDDMRIAVEHDDMLALTLVTGESAAHVPLAELDDDVRARVRLWLDTRKSEDADEEISVTTTCGRPKPTTAAVGLVEKIRGAVDRGDDDAVAHDVRSFGTIVDSHERYRVVSHVVVALMRAYRGDLVIEAFDASGTKAVELTEAARAALALAYAWAGQADAARALLHDVHGSDAADAWAQLGAASIARQDHNGVREALEHLVRLDRTHATVEELREHVRRLDRDEEGRAESELRDALAGVVDDDGRERLLRLHLERWRTSRFASGVLEELLERRRTARREDLLRRAGDEPDLERRLNLLREAQREGAAEVADEILALHAQVAERLVNVGAALIEEAIERDEVQGLRRWMKAEAAVADKVVMSERHAAAASLLREHRAGTDRVAAVLRFVDAGAAMAAGDHDEAGRLLELGGAFAERLAREGGLRAQLDAERLKVDMAREEAAIAEACAAMDAGDVERARRVLVGCGGAEAAVARARLAAMTAVERRPAGLRFMTPTRGVGRPIGSSASSSYARRVEILERFREMAEALAARADGHDALVLLVHRHDPIARAFWNAADEIDGVDDVRVGLVERKSFLEFAGAAVAERVEQDLSLPDKKVRIVVMASEGATIYRPSERSSTAA